MENWKELYKEVALKLKTEMPHIQWIDLWHNQINFLEEELPFHAPAIFLSFRAVATEDRGKNIQELNTQVDVYLFWETLADTFQGSYNQESALGFMDDMSAINKTLHGTDGVNFGNMRKLGIVPVDTGSAQNLYKLSFGCNVSDESAAKTADDIVDDDNDGENEPMSYDFA